MKKIIFRKLLKDYLVFFCIALISASVVIWVFQAVNFLDIIIEDGRDYLIFKIFFIKFSKNIKQINTFLYYFLVYFM